MIEMLKIIVMVCNINNGHKNIGFLEANAKDCRNKLINCMDKKSETNWRDNVYFFKKCIKESI